MSGAVGESGGVVGEPELWDEDSCKRAMSCLSFSASDSPEVQSFVLPFRGSEGGARDASIDGAMDKPAGRFRCKDREPKGLAERLGPAGVAEIVAAAEGLDPLGGMRGGMGMVRAGEPIGSRDYGGD